MAERQISRRELFRIAVTTAAGFGPTLINDRFTTQAINSLRETGPLAEMTSSPESVLFGGWFGWQWEHFAPMIAERSQIVTLFPEWQHPTWRRDEIQQVAARGKLAMASIGPGQNYAMKDLREQEPRLTELLKGYGETAFLLRPFYEMNGNWMHYGSKNNSPTETIDGWRWFYEQAHTWCPNVKIVWSPYVHHMGERYAVEDYYPGDRWVDIVGLDGYNMAQRSYYSYGIEKPNLEFKQLFGPDLRLMSKISSRPKIISEVGISADHPRALAWFRDAMETAPLYGVKAVCGFWQTKYDWGEENWNILGMPGAQTQIATTLAMQTSYIHTHLTSNQLMERLSS